MSQSAHQVNEIVHLWKNAIEAQEIVPTLECDMGVNQLWIPGSPARVEVEQL
jgi:hypothetical protein